jgi:hypothetical protein
MRGRRGTHLGRDRGHRVAHKGGALEAPAEHAQLGRDEAQRRVGDLGREDLVADNDERRGARVERGEGGHAAHGGRRAAPRALEARVGQRVRGRVAALGPRERRVGPRVGRGAKRGVAAIVEGAVLEADGAQEGPDIAVAPVEDRVDAHEGRPAGRGGAEGLLPARVRVAAARADHDRAQRGAASEQARNARLEVALERGHLQVVERVGRAREGDDLGEVARVLEEEGGHATEAARSGAGAEEPRDCGAQEVEEHGRVLAAVEAERDALGPATR